MDLGGCDSVEFACWVCRGLALVVVQSARWRRWALRQGIPADELQKAAEAALLVWPKGSIFEKTEFKVKDE